MRAGTVFAERFEIEREAGRGGMGIVYRARDRQAGGLVALKMMTLEGDAARFLREAAIIASLVHPGIVRYVASGQGDDGRLYLAMEWLEGEDLGKRIGTKGLGLAETLALARRAAQALEVAHAQQIVHRDVKPSNLFLVGGDIDRLTLLDFGIAKGGERLATMTATGAFLGTLGYTAPEQMQGARDIDARADIYSLGCVLFECLTGRRAIPGESPLEILAKSMLESVPDVRELRPDVPPAVADLIARTVAKAKEERHANATELLAEIVEIEQNGTLRLPPPKSRTRLTGEQRLVSLVLLSEPNTDLTGSATMSALSNAEQERLARALVERTGLSLGPESGGSNAELRRIPRGLLVTIRGGLSAMDLACAATRCAIGLRSLYPETDVSLTTGRIEGDVTAGKLANEAVRLALRAQGTGLVAVDTATARLLSTRFVVRDEGDASFVITGKDGHGAARTLLGKPTPCIGRDKEIVLLLATMEECASESVARVALVTAPAGVGKTRLMREVVERILADHHDALVFLASAEQGASRASLSLATSLVLGVTRLPAGSSPSRLYAALRSRVVDLGVPDGDVVLEFLSELAGVGGEGQKSALLLAARDEPRIMHEQMRRAFAAFVAAHAKRAPVVLVLEDLHWADTASLEYLAFAANACADLPLFVAAFARPEIKDALPDSITRLAVQEVRLSGLTKRAAERIVRLSAPALADDTVREIVARAAGNAFYLEELVRWVASASSATVTSLPETVLLMAQSRLERLPPEARRVLRAASVFGGATWIEAIEATLGDEPRVAEWVRLLVNEEVLEPIAESRIPGKREVAFRHALVREAAYATLTDTDRKEAHGVAALWLVDTGERDPLVLAEHFSLAGDGERAAPHFLRAATLAAEAGNLKSAIDLSKRGIDAGPTPADKGLLLATLAHAHGWRAEWNEVLDLAPLALDLLEPGTAPWWLVAGGTVFAGASTGDLQKSATIVRHVMALPGQPEASGPCGFAMALLTLGSLNSGRRDAAEMFAARFERIAAERGTRDPAFAGWLSLTRDALALYLADDVERGVREAQTGRQLFERSGDPIGRSLARIYEGVALFEVGDAAGARALHDAAIVLAKHHEVHYSEALATAQRARSLVDLGTTIDDARQAILSATPPAGERDMLIATIARLALAEAHLLAHALENDPADLANAKAFAEKVLESGSSSLPQASALEVLARVALVEGRLDEALALLDRGDAKAAITCYPRTRSGMAACRANALTRLGRTEEAARVRAEACARVDRIAQTLEASSHAGPWRAICAHHELRRARRASSAVGALQLSATSTSSTTSIGPSPPSTGSSPASARRRRNAPSSPCITSPGASGTAASSAYAIA